jgi:hypothetical protein
LIFGAVNTGKVFTINIFSPSFFLD